MKANDFLDQRRDETNVIIDTVAKEFGGIDQTLFCVKPSHDKWSIAECFQHLNLTLNIYMAQMVELVKKVEKYPRRNEIFNLSFVGKMAVKSMTPKPDNSLTIKMKTFGKLEPQQSNGEKTEILDEFNAHQQNTLEVIKGLRYMSLTKPKITTAIGPLLKMRIGDALHFMVAHNQRHIVQAQNVLKNITQVHRSDFKEII